MKIAVINDEKIKLDDIPKPSLDAKKGAIVKTIGCGLCGSDIVKLREHISKDGTVLGHEIVAEIVEINSNSGFKKGDVIVTSHHIPCGTCVYCKNGNISMCKHFKSTNIVPGGFSEYIYLSEEHLENVAHLKPENLTVEEASFYEPLGCCVRAVKRCNLLKASTVAVIGLGSIGILMAQALKAFGMNVIGFDLLEERIGFLKSKGIDAFNSQNLDNAKKYVNSKTENYGADAVFMTSGADKAIDLAFKVIRNGGKILVFSSTPRNTGYANNEIYYRELTVIGSYSPSPEDLKESLALLQSGKVDVKNISTTYEFDKIQQAFDDTINNKIMKAYIQI